MKMLEEKRPPREPVQSKTDRSGTCPFVNPCKTLRLRSHFALSGQTYPPARFFTRETD